MSANLDISQKDFRMTISFLDRPCLQGYNLILVQEKQPKAHHGMCMYRDGTAQCEDREKRMEHLLEHTPPGTALHACTMNEQTFKGFGKPTHQFGSFMPSSELLARSSKNSPTE